MRVICIEGNDIYHRLTCYWANPPWVKCLDSRKEYSSIETARRDNPEREPCGHCNPPRAD